MNKQQPGEMATFNVGLTSEQMVLCQNLASSLYGDYKKVEKVIKDAIECYAAQQKEVANNNNLFDKLSGLILASGFENALMQIMLKEMYCRDKKSMANYENVRKAAAMKMQKQFGEIHAGRDMELQETVRRLSNELEGLSAQIQVVTQEKTALQERYQKMFEKYTRSEGNYTDVTVALKSCMKLNQWQELRVQEAPKIRKRNSGIFKEQSWENAIQEFEYYNQKPNVPELKINIG